MEGVPHLDNAQLHQQKGRLILAHHQHYISLSFVAEIMTQTEV